MKKLLKCSLATIACLGLFSCSSSSTNSNGQTNTVENCEHVYEETIVERTDDDQGYTLHTCTKCGNTYKDNYLSSYRSLAESGEKAVINKLKSNLKDPDSLIYDGVCAKRYNLDEENPQLMEGSFMYKIHYNAKNSFGGYVGYKYVYYGYNGKLSSVGTESADYYLKYYYSAFYTFSNK